MASPPSPPPGRSSRPVRASSEAPPDGTRSHAEQRWVYILPEHVVIPDAISVGGEPRDADVGHPYKDLGRHAEGTMRELYIRSMTPGMFAALASETANFYLHADQQYAPPSPDAARPSYLDSTFVYLVRPYGSPSTVAHNAYVYIHRDYECVQDVYKYAGSMLSTVLTSMYMGHTKGVSTRPNIYFYYYTHNATIKLVDDMIHGGGDVPQWHTHELRGKRHSDEALYRTLVGLISGVAALTDLARLSVDTKEAVVRGGGIFTHEIDHYDEAVAIGIAAAAEDVAHRDATTITRARHWFVKHLINRKVKQFLDYLYLIVAEYDGVFSTAVRGGKTIKDATTSGTKGFFKWLFDTGNSRYELVAPGIVPYDGNLDAIARGIASGDTVPEELVEKLAASTNYLLWFLSTGFRTALVTAMVAFSARYLGVISSLPWEDMIIDKATQIAYKGLRATWWKASGTVLGDRHSMHRTGSYTDDETRMMERMWNACAGVLTNQAFSEFFISLVQFYKGALISIVLKSAAHGAFWYYAGGPIGSTVRTHPKKALLTAAGAIGFLWFAPTIEHATRYFSSDTARVVDEESGFDKKPGPAKQRAAKKPSHTKQRTVKAKPVHTKQQTSRAENAYTKQWSAKRGMVSPQKTQKPLDETDTTPPDADGWACDDPDGVCVEDVDDTEDPEDHHETVDSGDEPSQSTSKGVQPHSYEQNAVFRKQDAASVELRVNVSGGKTLVKIDKYMQTALEWMEKSCKVNTTRGACNLVGEDTMPSEFLLKSLQDGTYGSSEANARLYGMLNSVGLCALSLALEVTVGITSGASALASMNFINASAYARLSPDDAAGVRDVLSPYIDKVKHDIVITSAPSSFLLYASQRYTASTLKWEVIAKAIKNPSLSLGNLMSMMIDIPLDALQSAMPSMTTLVVEDGDALDAYLYLVHHSNMVHLLGGEINILKIPAVTASILVSIRGLFDMNGIGITTSLENKARFVADHLTSNELLRPIFTGNFISEVKHRPLFIWLVQDVEKNFAYISRLFIKDAFSTGLFGDIATRVGVLYDQDVPFNGKEYEGYGRGVNVSKAVIFKNADELDKAVDQLAESLREQYPEQSDRIALLVAISSVGAKNYKMALRDTSSDALVHGIQQEYPDFNYAQCVAIATFVRTKYKTVLNPIASVADATILNWVRKVAKPTAEAGVLGVAGVAAATGHPIVSKGIMFSSGVISEFIVKGGYKILKSGARAVGDKVFLDIMAPEFAYAMVTKDIGRWPPAIVTAYQRDKKAIAYTVVTDKHNDVMYIYAYHDMAIDIYNALKAEGVSVTRRPTCRGEPECPAVVSDSHSDVEGKVYAHLPYQSTIMLEIASDQVFGANMTIDEEFLGGFISSYMEQSKSDKTTQIDSHLSPVRGYTPVLPGWPGFDWIKTIRRPCYAHRFVVAGGITHRKLQEKGWPLNAIDILYSIDAFMDENGLTVDTLSAPLKRISGNPKYTRQKYHDIVKVSVLLRFISDENLLLRPRSAWASANKIINQYAMETDDRLDVAKKTLVDINDAIRKNFISTSSKVFDDALYDLQHTVSWSQRAKKTGASAKRMFYRASVIDQYIERVRGGGSVSDVHTNLVSDAQSQIARLAEQGVIEREEDITDLKYLVSVMEDMPARFDGPKFIYDVVFDQTTGLLPREGDKMTSGISRRIESIAKSVDYMYNTVAPTVAWRSLDKNNTLLAIPPLPRDADHDGTDTEDWLTRFEAAVSSTAEYEIARWSMGPTTAAVCRVALEGTASGEIDSHAAADIVKVIIHMQRGGYVSYGRTDDTSVPDTLLFDGILGSDSKLDADYKNQRFVAGKLVSAVIRNYSPVNRLPVLNVIRETTAQQGMGIPSTLAILLDGVANSLPPVDALEFEAVTTTLQSQFVHQDIATLFDGYSFRLYASKLYKLSGSGFAQKMREEPKNAGKLVGMYRRVGLDPPEKIERIRLWRITRDLLDVCSSLEEFDEVVDAETAKDPSDTSGYFTQLKSIGGSDHSDAIKAFLYRQAALVARDTHKEGEDAGTPSYMESALSGKMQEEITKHTTPREQFRFLQSITSATSPMTVSEYFAPRIEKGIIVDRMDATVDNAVKRFISKHHAILDRRRAAFVAANQGKIDEYKWMITNILDALLDNPSLEGRLDAVDWLNDVHRDGGWTGKSTFPRKALDGLADKLHEAKPGDNALHICLTWDEGGPPLIATQTQTHA